MSAECKIYIITCCRDDQWSGPVKVGISNNPDQRRAEIQTCCPYEVQVAFVFTAANRQMARSIEGAFHRVMSKKQTFGEWFDMAPHEAAAAMCTNIRALLATKFADFSEEELGTALRISGVAEAEARLLAGEDK